MQKLRIMYILKLLLRLQTFFSAQSLCSSSSCIMMEHAFWMSPSISDCVVVVAAQGEQPIMLLLPPPPAADLTMIRGPHDSPPSNSGQRSANPHTLRTVAIHSKQKRKQTGINVLQMMLFHVKGCGEIVQEDCKPPYFANCHHSKQMTKTGTNVLQMLFHVKGFGANCLQ